MIDGISLKKVISANCVELPLEANVHTRKAKRVISVPSRERNCAVQSRDSGVICILGKEDLNCAAILLHSTTGSESLPSCI